MNISECKIANSFYPNVGRIQPKQLSAPASPAGVGMVHLGTLILEDVVGENKGRE